MFSNLSGLARRGAFLLAAALAIIILSSFAFAQSGSGNGGGNQNNPLPQTAPAPGVIIRESFGWGPQGLRPAGGNGILTDTIQVAWLNDFWVEYKGSNNQRWLSQTINSTWNFCGSDQDPFEMPSPLQIVNGVFQNGCLASARDEIGGAFPTAITQLPGGINTPFEVSIDGFVVPQPGNYLALGLTNSNALAGNFFAFGSAVLVIRNQFENSISPILFELRAGNLNGQVLAHGVATGNGFLNQLKIRYNPRTKTLGAQINDAVIDPVPVNFSTPKYVGFEGIGVVDNFVVKAL